MNLREQELCDWILDQIVGDYAEPELLAGHVLELAHTYPTVHVGAKDLETLQVQIGHARNEYHQHNAGDLLSPTLNIVGHLLAHPDDFKELSEYEITNVDLVDLPQFSSLAARGIYTIKNATTAVDVAIDMDSALCDQHLTLHHRG
jgi:hypothetical protein